ncbi:MAG: type II toxin-antitoxin system VapC family toxin [Luteolibacter sp.]
MSFLVDVNVLSEAIKPVPSERVVSWLRTHENNLVLDPIVLGEIRLGILLLPKGQRRRALEVWFSGRVGSFVCIPWDAETAMRWAALLADLRKRGLSMPLKDSMIAATALTHDLTVATRNIRDFLLAKVKVVNPFD